MSMGNDYIADVYADLIEMTRRIETEAKVGIWQTRDGRQIRVEDMTDSHLQNTIAYLQRTDTEDHYLPWIIRMENELRMRHGRAYSERGGA